MNCDETNTRNEDFEEHFTSSRSFSYEKEEEPDDEIQGQKPVKETEEDNRKKSDPGIHLE